MKLIAFLQLRNELENGHLDRCLTNCEQWADEIFIYDDCSTDGSLERYLLYTDRVHIIRGTARDFAAEQSHKQQLLALALTSNPDWIGWIDGDAILDHSLTRGCREMLAMYDEQGFDGVRLHNLNLWRHPAWYRLDNAFNGLWHVVFWKNNGMLHYQPQHRLHQQQYPHGMRNIGGIPENDHLLHFGFSTETCIARKYLTYKSYGQVGWELDRLIDEQSSFELEKVPFHLYPHGTAPEDYHTAPKPTPLLYNEYRVYDSWEQYCSPLP